MSKGNMLMGMARGKVGDVVFSRRLGQQVARAYVSRVNDAATRAQVAQRSKLGNLVANYRALRPVLQKAFESKAPGQTDYNLFVGANLSNSQVFLTKAEVAGGAGVAAPYIISKGSLQPILVIENPDGVFITDIAVPAGFAIGDATTVGALSDAIVSANFDWEYGDQLTIVVVDQSIDANLGIPQIAGRFYEVTLSSGDIETVRSIFPEEIMSIQGSFIGLDYPEFVGAGAHIQSRRTADGRLLVSPATMLLSNSNNTYAAYSGKAAETRAVNTRGYNPEALLNPGGDSSSAPAPNPGGTNPVLSSITIDGYTLNAGDTTRTLAADSFLVVRGNNLSAADVNFSVMLSSGSTVEATPAQLFGATDDSGAPTQLSFENVNATYVGGWITRIRQGSRTLATYNDNWQDPNA